MKPHKPVFATILLALCCFYSSAQEVPENTKQQLENLAEVTEEETENDELQQQWNYLKKDPLNLNTATAEDLQLLPFITGLQIQNLIRYRAFAGQLISIYELQSIPAWDVGFIYKILPFIAVNNSLLLKETILNRMKEGGHSLLIRESRVVEKSKGYSTNSGSRYLGDRNHLVLRYRYQYKNLLQYGVTADKDAGENFFKKNNSGGFDFYSAHLFARNIGIIKSLAAGDYTVNLGQGLIQWQSLAFKKGSEVMNIKRQSPVLKPYSSTGEFYYNRGVAATLQKGAWQATVFGSTKNIDANINTDTLDHEFFSSFITSGLHRNASEIDNKNKVRQTSYGGNIRFQKSIFSLGFNSVAYHFSKALSKQDKPYNLYALNGKAWRNESFDYSITYKNLHFFGEAAADKNFHKAFVNGALISVDPKVDLSLLHRHISKEYQAVYGNAFTESFQPSNESGFYAGISIRPSPVFKLDAYADFYRFPWLKFRTDAPGYGKDFLVQLSYQPNKLAEVYTRYRYENKQINESENNGATNYVIGKPRQNWRVHFSYSLSPVIALRNRLDMIWYDKKGKASENGFLFFTEMHYRFSQPLSANIRFQYFETDGFNSRIYAYENDVLYSYSIPSFFDKGIRYYSNINYDLNKKLSFWVRWAQTVYTDKTLIGSGLDEINNNKRSEGKLQIMIHL